MNEINCWICQLLILTGSIFLLTTAVGIFRFKNTYYRLHAASKGLTLGVALIIAGIFWQIPDNFFRAKLLIIFLFYLVTNPIAATAISKVCYKKKVSSRRLVALEIE